MDNKNNNDKKTISAENLPLSVREHLMRGQYNSAVSLLTTDYDQSSQQATDLIEAYRAALRERKIALDIEIMQQQNSKETKENTQQILMWGARALVLLFVILLFYLMVDTG